jgi:hypothetical protein
MAQARLDPEDEGTTVFLSAGNYSQNDPAWIPRKY